MNELQSAIKKINAENEHALQHAVDGNSGGTNKHFAVNVGWVELRIIVSPTYDAIFDVYMTASRRSYFGTETGNLKSGRITVLKFDIKTIGPVLTVTASLFGNELIIEYLSKLSGLPQFSEFPNSPDHERIALPL